MTTLRRIFTGSTLALLLALVATPAALAQATRTWVSGTGDDANPCSRTAPCKTFAGAVSKTAVGGEINAIDPGGFGAITIVNSLTIDATGTQAGVLVSGTNAIVIDNPNAVVVLRNLNIDGLGTGLDGIDVIAAKRVSIENSRIYNFTKSAVDFAVTNSGATLNVINSELFNNTGTGVFVAPPTGSATVTLTGDDIDGNGCGIVAGSYGFSGSFTTGCGAANSSGTGTGKGSIAAFHSAINNNGTAGVYSAGTRASVELGDDSVTGNSHGLDPAQGGAILSWSDNFVYGNTFNGTPTGTITPLIRRAKAHSRAKRAHVRHRARKRV